MSRGTRTSMYNDNVFKIGLFGANCSSGRAVTMVPERWSATWRDNLALAKMADAAGIDFLLPIGRWKGYGGDTDYQGATFETITWATGLLAQTERITVFGTVHAPLFPPIIAAKQIVTADHVGEGRFGLNIVCGWNEGEFEMFGVQPGDHERRYKQGQEWIDALRRIWTEDDFDFNGDIIRLRGVRAKPKPWDQTRPLMMNAAVRPKARPLRFGIAMRSSPPRGARSMRQHRSRPPDISARQPKRKRARSVTRSASIPLALSLWRATEREADEYYRYVEENTDWNAVDSIMEMKGLNDRPPEGSRTHPVGLFARHGWSAARRHPGFYRCGIGGNFRGRLRWHRGLVRQLPQRAAVLPRRGLAAARTARHPQPVIGGRLVTSNPAVVPSINYGPLGHARDAVALVVRARYRRSYRWLRLPNCGL